MAKPGMSDATQGVKPQTVQVHLRLPLADASLLKEIANERNQSPSGLVRSLLRALRKAQRAKE